MDWLHTVALALIQGITEFLPISSSAHLVLPSALLGWPDQGLAFDVAVHVGSLSAVLLYFRHEIAGFTASGLQWVQGRGFDDNLLLLSKIVVATLPVVIAGALLKDVVATSFRSIAVIATTTIVFGLLLGLADRRRTHNSTISWGTALFIGAAQVLAIVPGTSRSGITMTAALLAGLSRTSASRFSFLLSIPTILGGGTLVTLDLIESGIPVDWVTLGAAAAISGVSAYLCIRFFIALVERTGMLPYVIYRLLLGAGLFALLGAGLI